MVTEITPVLDSQNPDLGPSKPMEPEKPPEESDGPEVELVGEDLEADPEFKSYQSSQGQSHAYVPPTPTNPSTNTFPHFDLNSSDPSVINDLLHTIEILKKSNQMKDKRLENAAKVKEQDEKIKAKQAEKIESLIKEKHVSDMDLAKAKRDLKNIRSGIFSKSQKKQVIKDVMGKVGYTPAQLDCFLRGDWKKGQKWSEEDVKFALSLRTISRRAYRWIRKKKLIPLAGDSTLRRYMRTFQVPPGKTHSLIFHPS